MWARILFAEKFIIQAKPAALHVAQNACILQNPRHRRCAARMETLKSYMVGLFGAVKQELDLNSDAATLQLGA
jgi:hypothetical protein